MQNLYSCGNYVERHVSEENQKLVREKCCGLWEKLAAHSQSLNMHVILQHVVMNLLQMSALLVHTLDNKQIYQVFMILFSNISNHLVVGYDLLWN